MICHSAGDASSRAARMTVTCTPPGAGLVITIDRPPVDALDLATIESLQTFAAIAEKPPAAQVRGPLASRVAMLAARGDDPFLASFL